MTDEPCHQVRTPDGINCTIGVGGPIVNYVIGHNCPTTLQRTPGVIAWWSHTVPSGGSPDDSLDAVGQDIRRCRVLTIGLHRPMMLQPFVPGFAAWYHSCKPSALGRVAIRHRARVLDDKLSCNGMRVPMTALLVGEATPDAQQTVGLRSPTMERTTREKAPVDGEARGLHQHPMRRASSPSGIKQTHIGFVNPMWGRNTVANPRRALSPTE